MLKVLPAWRGAGGGHGWGWSQCVRWESGEESSSQDLECPLWCVLCRGGRDRLKQACQIGKGALRLPADMLSLKLPQLFDIHQVPKKDLEIMRVFQEDNIISGYRHPRSSALDCILSSLHMTNETMNIWTHFLPTWYYLWRFCLLCCTVDFLSDSYTWPLLVYMLLVCLYPFTSSCAHTFSTMSTDACHICYFFDYAALSLYSLGCAITYGSYAMPDCWVNSWLHHYFVPIAICNTLFCTGMSCYSRFVELQCPHRSKVMRTSAFVVPFLFDSCPLFYRVLSCCWESCSPNEALANHGYHLIFAFLTCFLFASHLPERLAPGRFDYFGHSHQLFHVCAVVGTYFQMEALLADMRSRKEWLTSHSALPSFQGTLGAFALGVLLNLALIGFFSASLPRTPRQSTSSSDAALTQKALCGDKEE
ncbi:membrane progestin receptor delta isoform X1 [Paramisgurnus dabryanus]|uniref:membrane progestin receptor delta isoform X1 n=1 Tax=Paramisgurnus dabryanus TaxID=90735 RepID=UPI0031F44B6E